MDYEDAMHCEKRMTNDGFYFNPTGDEVKSTHATKYYEASCPDCGKQAEYKVTVFTGKEIKQDHCRLVTINCHHCEYYEFITTGKDI